MRDAALLGLFALAVLTLGLGSGSFTSSDDTAVSPQPQLTTTQTTSLLEPPETTTSTTDDSPGTDTGDGAEAHNHTLGPIEGSGNGSVIYPSATSSTPTSPTTTETEPAPADSGLPLALAVAVAAVLVAVVGYLLRTVDLFDDKGSRGGKPEVATPEDDASEGQSDDPDPPGVDLPGADASPDANAVVRAWATMARGIEGVDLETATPGDVARAAVAEGRPPGAVSALTDAFNRVRYGYGDPAEHRARAESALDDITGTADGTATDGGAGEGEA